MIILAIDPGNIESAFCFYKVNKDKVATNILAKGKVVNEKVLSLITSNTTKISRIYVEDIAQYGTGVGKTIFDTVKFIGRLLERADSLKIPIELVYRKTYISYILDNPKANDSIVRQYLMDTFGDKGTKKNPGPMFGFAADMFSALMIAVYGSEIELRNK